MTIHLVETYEEDACIAVARHIGSLLDEGQVRHPPRTAGCKGLAQRSEQRPRRLLASVNLTAASEAVAASHRPKLEACCCWCCCCRPRQRWQTQQAPCSCKSASQQQQRAGGTSSSSSCQHTWTWCSQSAATRVSVDDGSARLRLEVPSFGGDCIRPPLPAMAIHWCVLCMQASPAVAWTESYPAQEVPCRHCQTKQACLAAVEAGEEGCSCRAVRPRTAVQQPCT